MFDTFMQKLSQFGLEFFRKYYTVYRAEVTSIDDPEARGRVQVFCPEVGALTAINRWVEPSFPAAGKNRGTFWPPEVGDSVWVAFERGDSALPRTYWGGWFGDDEVPTELKPEKKKAPKKRGFVLRNGMRLVFDETADSETVELVWHKPDSQPTGKVTATRDSESKAYLQFDKNGSVTLKNKNKTSVMLDAENKKITVEDKDNSNTIVIDSNGVKITTSKDVIIADAANCKINAKNVTIADGADNAAVRGDDLKSWLEQHQHPTAVGPSGPPITAAALTTTLSTVVKLK
jgi:uncharacterized protein involved in type VI secretion and phage assembly